MLVMHLVFPGVPQLVAGNRKFARIGIAGSLFFWALAALAGLIYLLNRNFLIWLATNSIAVVVFAGILVVWAVIYLLLSLDTIRLMRLGGVPVGQRRGLLIAMLTIAAVGTSSLAYAGNLGFAQSNLLGKVFSQHGTLEPVNGRFNILLLGGDAGKDRFGLRPDSISVLSIDAQTGQAVNIGIPRNLEYVKFVKGSPMTEPHPNGWNCGLDCMINGIYKDTMDNHAKLYPNAVKNGSDPGVEATRDAVEWVTGLDIQSYVLIDMAGFKQLINALGGLDINVESRLPIGGEINPDGTLVGVKGWIEPGMQHMDGYTALWYARSRHASHDYDRMARQRIVENAILQQLDPMNIIARFNEIATAGKSIVRTDIPSDMVSTFVDLALKAKKLGVTPLELVPPKFNPGNPDFKGIRSIIKKAVTPIPTSSPSN